MDSSSLDVFSFKPSSVNYGIPPVSSMFSRKSYLEGDASREIDLMSTSSITVSLSLLLLLCIAHQNFMKLTDFLYFRIILVD